jgi:glycosidase
MKPAPARRLLLLFAGALAACTTSKPTSNCPIDCGAHGKCIAPGGDRACACDKGFVGERCDVCDTGFYRDGTECLADGSREPLVTPAGDPLVASPTIDGIIHDGDTDWPLATHVATSQVASNWGANQLTDLYLAYDANYLYVGVKGTVEPHNAIVVTIDTDYGELSLGTASLRDYNGKLDHAMSAGLKILDPQFRADLAVGTVGLASAKDAVADDAGWRSVGSKPEDFSWLKGDLIASSDGFEARLPIASAFVPPLHAEQRIALFARIASSDGSAFANQTLPADDAAQPQSISVTSILTLVNKQGALCNRNGSCEAGESRTSCPSDCRVDAGACDDAAFRWDDAVIYFAMTDRFFDSDGHADPVPGVSDFAAQYEGGDWAGVTAKLDYLKNLGANTIWLAAPYKNRDLPGGAVDPGSDAHLYTSYHGYWPSPEDISYADPRNPSPLPAVETRLGSAQGLHQLVDAVHANGMRMLFDFVMRHVDVTSGLYTAHPDWFVSIDGAFKPCQPNLWDDPYWSTRCSFTSYLAPFDYYKPEVRAWSIADATWWAREFGIDGYRLDAIKHVPADWLIELRAAMTTAFPSPAGGRFYLVGETFDYDNRFALRALVDPATKLDGQFDFPFRKRVCDALFAGTVGLDALVAWLDSNEAFYGAGALMSTWLGNHDLPRVIHYASGQLTDCYSGASGWSPGEFTEPADAAAYERLGLAFALMLTSHGVPMIYYGDEIGMAGGGDPDNRRMMRFDGLTPDQEKLRDLVSSLGHLRQQHVVLRRGYRQTLASSPDSIAYKMTGCGAARDVLVLINRADASTDLAGLPPGNYTDLLTSAPTTLGDTMTLAPRSVTLLQPR